MSPNPPNPQLFNERTLPDNVLVAEDRGRLTGSLKIRPVPLAHPELEASCGHVHEIHGLSVDPHHQGRGTGRALLRAARRIAVDRGARRITLRVLGGNVRAQALYLSCGYVVEGVLRAEFRIQDRYVDDVLMALDLRTG